uniref:Uncharacterized protein n=1 Tax=Biomphalaria glabrata TaxID=6526 RepID=A0A2C9M2Q1_BIOGL
MATEGYYGSSKSDVKKGYNYDDDKKGEVTHRDPYMYNGAHDNKEDDLYKPKDPKNKENRDHKQDEEKPKRKDPYSLEKHETKSEHPREHEEHKPKEDDKEHLPEKEKHKPKDAYKYDHGQDEVKHKQKDVHNGEEDDFRRGDEKHKQVESHKKDKTKSNEENGGARKGKPKDKKVASVRRKFYDGTELDDVLQDKIATQLRENGIAETKVIPLSAKITQAVRDDVMDPNASSSPQVTANLTEAINKHLDPILYNRPNQTDLSNSQKPSDASHLSNLILLRIGQVHEEIELCKLSVDDPLKSTRRNKHGATPRDDPPDRSMVMAIKDGIEKQKTEKDILQEKLRQAQRETGDVEDDKDRTQRQLQELDAENWQLKRNLQEAENDKQSLINKVREQQSDYDRLDKSYQDARNENQRLKKRLEERDNENQLMSNDLARLQSENARLQVLVDQKHKEILHLRDPDKDMVHQIKILSDEVTLLRTQTRRLNEEKGLLKSRNQKMESTIDETYKLKSKLSQERDDLWRENQELKQRYRKLALATPNQRTLPDIMAGHNGPSSRSTPRTTSRNRHSGERRMSPTREEDDEGGYH